MKALILALSFTFLSTGTAMADDAPTKKEKRIHALGYKKCSTWRCVEKVKKRRIAAQHRAFMRVIRPYIARFKRMAQCESGGNWHISTGNGFYGGLQFTLQSWRAVGGVGYPHHASRYEQMYRAVLLMRIQGWGAWPHCQYA